MKTLIYKLFGANKSTQEKATDIYTEAEQLAEEIKRDLVSEHNKLARLTGSDRRTERKRERLAKSIKELSDILENVHGTSKSAAFIAGLEKS
jgi:hypothetical protein